jgi:hypothetical protein
VPRLRTAPNVVETTLALRLRVRGAGRPADAALEDNAVLLRRRDTVDVGAHLQKMPLFSTFFTQGRMVAEKSWSRACLGNLIVFGIKWREKGASALTSIGSE